MAGPVSELLQFLCKTNSLIFFVNFFTTVLADDLNLGSSQLTIVFLEGTLKQILCKDIQIVNDLILEGEHDFNLTIVSAGSSPHAMISTDSSVTTITILDDERELVLYTTTYIGW